MNLIDILCLVSDTSTVEVFENGESIAIYDGKNAIPDELNARDVIALEAGYYKINVEI